MSQILTLYTTPVIYLLLDRLHRRLGGRGPQTAGDEAAAGRVGAEAVSFRAREAGPGIHSHGGGRSAPTSVSAIL